MNMAGGCLFPGHEECLDQDCTTPPPPLPRTMRFGSTAKVLLKCKFKYYRISECPATFPMFCL